MHCGCPVIYATSRKNVSANGKPGRVQDTSVIYADIVPTTPVHNSNSHEPPDQVIYSDIASSSDYANN